VAEVGELVGLLLVGENVNRVEPATIDPTPNVVPLIAAATRVPVTADSDTENVAG
jgi:hypothetical protein